MEQKGDGCLGASNHNLVIARTVVVTRTKDSPSQGNCLSLSHTHTQTEMLQKDLLRQDGRNDEKIVIQK